MFYPDLARVTALNDASMVPATQIDTQLECYRDASDNIQKASSRIRFATRNDIAARLAEAGLRVEQWLGDWSGGAFEDGSPEIIPVGGLG